MYGAAPALWSRAPGRVDLMGSHTDYNLGYVMTMTVDRDTWLAVRPRADRTVRIASLNRSGQSTFSLDQIDHDPQVPWADYVRGMALVLGEAGYPLRGLDALVHSTVPFASGLSSSAALEMAAGVAFQLAGGFQVDPVELALLGQRAENHFVGVNSGILDQYSSAMGHDGTALLLDCRDLSSHAVALAPDVAVVICDTCAPRSLAGTEYGERRAQCEEGVRLLSAFYPGIRALRDVTAAQLAAHSDALPAVVARRCRFIVEENQRVLDLAQALPAGERARLRALTDASFAGARDLYEITCPEMRAMHAAMLSAPGAIGARQAGAGFGGCLVAFVDRQSVAEFAAHVRTAYQTASGISPEIHLVRPSAGAGPV